METTAPPPQKKQHNRKVDYVISIAINGAMLYVANHLLGWQAEFISAAWSDVLPIINLSLGLTIAAYVVFVVHDGRTLYFVGRTMADALGLVMSYRVLQVFPFDFSKLFSMGWLNTVAPTLIIIGIVGLLASMIIRTVKFVHNKNIHY